LLFAEALDTVLAWRFELRAPHPVVRQFAYVDAHSGETNAPSIALLARMRWLTDGMCAALEQAWWWIWCKASPTR
jgi:hypothetical protein